MEKKFSNEEVRHHASMLKVKINADKKVAPRYTVQEDHLLLYESVITEMGTESELPVVDFLLVDAEGKKHYAFITGRVLQAIVAQIQSINYKNHGNTNP